MSNSLLIYTKEFLKYVNVKETEETVLHIHCASISMTLQVQCQPACY